MNLVRSAAKSMSAMRVSYAVRLKLLKTKELRKKGTSIAESDKIRLTKTVERDP